MFRNVLILIGTIIGIFMILNLLQNKKIYKENYQELRNKKKHHHDEEDVIDRGDDEDSKEQNYNNNSEYEDDTEYTQSSCSNVSNESKNHVKKHSSEENKYISLKSRMNNQVEAGTYINPEYEDRKNFNCSLSEYKIYKPQVKKLENLRKLSIKTPETIRKVFDKSILNFKKSKNYLRCQTTQKNVTMKPILNDYSTYDKNAPKTFKPINNIYPNDTFEMNSTYNIYN